MEILSFLESSQEEYLDVRYSYGFIQLSINGHRGRVSIALPSLEVT